MWNTNVELQWTITIHFKNEGAEGIKGPVQEWVNMGEGG
jgi:hypothetical protein